MRRLPYRHVLVLLAVTTLAACDSDGTPTTPAPTDPPAALPPAPPPAPQPGNSQTVGTYERRSPSFAGPSRYILAADDRFVLQYEHGSYGGRYSRTGPEFSFQFDGWSIAGPWMATGLLREDVLTVTYNDIMVASDFEDGEYVRIQ